MKNHDGVCPRLVGRYGGGGDESELWKMEELEGNGDGSLSCSDLRARRARGRDLVFCVFTQAGGPLTRKEEGGGIRMKVKMKIGRLEDWWSGERS